MDALNSLLGRWLEAGLVDGATADRIRAFESERAPERSFRWPAILAIAFGALMVGGGLLLFVAAHWDAMSPASRFLTVLAQVGIFHLAGAFLGDRAPKVAVALHGLGTAALGAGIFLAGQIFNLEEHWPGGVMLWALGAWIGFALLRDWVQGLLAARLTPFWLAGEWVVATERWRSGAGEERILAFGLLMLALAYLTARRDETDRPLRKALMWVGGLAFLPCVFGAIAASAAFRLYDDGAAGTTGLLAFGWIVALLAPLLLALWLRGRGAWMNLVGAFWAWMLGAMNGRELPLYAWCALGAVGLVFWGLHEARRERVNLGVAGFALTLLFFYFSSVMGKLGRSLGLMGLGLLFLLGGWQLERLRRRLNARIAEGGAR
jgi:uncharacterized membrane protein